MQEEITISNNLQSIRNSKEIILGLLNKIYLLQEEVNSLKAENKKLVLTFKSCPMPKRDLDII